MRLTVGTLRKSLEGLDENLEVVVYNDCEECDTFLYGSPVVCTADEFNYCAGDSVAYAYDGDEEGKLYCYFGNR